LKQYFRSYNDYQDISEQLKVKYNESLQLFKKMHSDFPHERFNCYHILERKNSWALNEELEINDELQNIIASKEYENEFTIYSILRSEKKILNQKIQVQEQ
jgi:hypothetical protein